MLPANVNQSTEWFLCVRAVCCRLNVVSFDRAVDTMKDGTAEVQTTLGEVGRLHISKPPHLLSHQHLNDNKLRPHLQVTEMMNFDGK